MDNRKQLIDNLNRLLKIKGVKRADVAHDLDLTTSTVFNWFSGVSYPRIENLEQLAKYFGVDITDLVKEEGGISSPDITRINVYSRVHWDGIKFMTKELPQFEEIPTRLAKTGEFFALRLDDSSMSPRLDQGDILIVKKIDNIIHGKLLIITISNENAICRKVIKNEFGITLQAFNPLYESHFFSYADMVKVNVQVIAEVIESRRKFI